ncbi:MAG: helix-turn-helix domain-containing protein [Pseudomonadota bacterium]
MAEASPPITARRNAPHQKRSRETVGLILNAAAELLEEVGFEKLSTNMICKRANLTPPALYRYFPNKYAVLKELGERLMAAQNDLIDDLDIHLSDPAKIETQIVDLLTATLKVTHEMPAGGWIMRSLHATPILSDVRRDSHRRVSRALTDRMLEAWPNLDWKTSYRTNRLGVEMGYALIEMLFDEPELDHIELIQASASMLAHNLRSLLKNVN